jgi:hypothetical protein
MERPDYVGVAPFGPHFLGTETDDTNFYLFLIAGDAKVETSRQIMLKVRQIAADYDKEPMLYACFSEYYFVGNFTSKHPRAIYHHATHPLMHPIIGRDDRILHLRELAKLRHKKALGDNAEFAAHEISECVRTSLFWERDFQKEISADLRERRSKWWRGRVEDLFRD